MDADAGAGKGHVAQVAAMAGDGGAHLVQRGRGFGGHAVIFEDGEDAFLIPMEGDVDLARGALPQFQPCDGKVAKQAAEVFQKADIKGDVTADERGRGLVPVLAAVGLDEGFERAEDRLDPARADFDGFFL